MRTRRKQAKACTPNGSVYTDLPMPESTAPGATVKAVLLVAFMWVAYFLNYCDRLAVVAMFPVLEKELGLSDTQQGLTVAIFIWVYGALSPVAGQLADRFSK